MKITMSKIKMLLTVFTVILYSLAGAQSQENDNRVLMTIAGDNVTVGDFMHVYNKNNINKDESSQQALRDYLDLYVNFRLKVNGCRLQKKRIFC